MPLVADLVAVAVRFWLPLKMPESWNADWMRPFALLLLLLLLLI